MYILTYGRWCIADIVIEKMCEKARLSNIKHSTRFWIRHKRDISRSLLTLRGISLHFFIFLLYLGGDVIISTLAFLLALIINVTILGFKVKAFYRIKECIHGYHTHNTKYKTNEEYAARMETVNNIMRPIRFWLTNNIFHVFLIVFLVLTYTSFDFMTPHQFTVSIFLALVSNSLIDFLGTWSIYSNKNEGYTYEKECNELASSEKITIVNGASEKGKQELIALLLERKIHLTRDYVVASGSSKKFQIKKELEEIQIMLKELGHAEK